VGAGGVANMTIESGPRVGILYAECTVIKAAGGAGVFSLPLVTDIIHPTKEIQLKVNDIIQFDRLITELMVLQKLVSADNGGSVSYYQAGVLVAKVYDVMNAIVPAAVAANTATMAVFEIPIYLAEPARKIPQQGEELAWPTRFLDGSVLKPLTIDVPTANNAGAAFSGHKIRFWMECDDLAWPAPTASNPLLIIKRRRFTIDYAATGDLPISFIKKDKLLQFSLLLAAGDTFESVLVKKNGITLRDVTPDRNAQALHAHGFNTAEIVILPDALPGGRQNPC
jgi:hypothetical protein